MNLQELLTQLDTPIVIRPTRRMTQGELETYLDKAADILRGNADHSEFRGYVFALLFYKRISDCYDEEVRTQTDALVKAGVPRDQAVVMAHDAQLHHFTVPEQAAWADVARTAKGQLGQALNESMLSIERANAHRQNNFDGIRHGADRVGALACIVQINGAESGFTFCKENCSGLALRLTECVPSSDEVTELRGMMFSPGSLAGRTLSRVAFYECQFQPTSTAKSKLSDLLFRQCEFERIECDEDQQLAGCSFVDCRVDSLVILPDGEQTFDPTLIEQGLRRAGAQVGAVADAQIKTGAGDVDERVRQLERFLRVFLRSTHVDEEVIRLRLGKNFAPSFFDEVLPSLLNAGLLEEVPWRGGGYQRRYKLVSSMSTIERALERSRGDFDGFLRLVRTGA